MPRLPTKTTQVNGHANATRLRNLPAELQALARWVCWAKSDDGGKKPINPRTGMGASSTNPDDWLSFEEALQALSSGDYAGVMFAMVPDDGYVFIDLDGCRNPTNKGINKWATDILTTLDSYAETSPSETGVHVFVRATKPGERCRHGDVEIYDHARFACMTGRRLERFPATIECRQAELESVYKKHVAISQIGPDRAVPAVPCPVPPEKLEALLKNSKAFTIYNGQQNGQYHSQSEADLALMNIAVSANFSEDECRTVVQTARENAGADAKHDGYFQLTFQKARGDVKPVTLQEAHETFQRHLLLTDVTTVDVALAIFASSHLEGEPCWLHIVAPPSSGKTEIIRSGDGWSTVYSLTELTPAGLVSGFNAEDGKDHSLLPLLHCKTLAIKDFTPTIDAPKDLRQKLFGRLRDAFDGYASYHTAMVGTRTHKGSFNCLTAVTNAIEKVWRNTSLGERYLLHRMPAMDGMEAGKRALMGATAKNEMRAQLRRATCGVLAGIDMDMVPTCSEGIQDAIVKLAAMLAMARTFVERENHEVVFIPQPEGPSRIAQQLFKLGQGLALINGRREIDDSDVAILARVAIDSIPLKRSKIIKLLVEHRTIQTDKLMAKVGMSQSATHEALEDLCMLKICAKHEPEGKGLEANLKANAYTITDEFDALVDGMGFGTAARNA